MAKGGTSSSIPAERLAQYERAIATLPGVERKGVTLPYTSLNGHMFSFLADDGRLAIRMPPGDREAFLARYTTTLHRAHGTVMKEWVTVPDALVADTASLGPHLQTAYAYVAAMKPKPTRRKT
jgi:hypothetical protein